MNYLACEKDFVIQDSNNHDWYSCVSCNALVGLDELFNDSGICTECIQH